VRGLIAFLSRVPSRAAPGAPGAPIGAAGAPADAIFVFAGNQARKEFGAASWRSGTTPVLVLSVGRFEWRRYAGLGLPGDAALREAVARVPPRERHFFVILDAGGAEIRPVRLRPFGTRNEARALESLARERGWRAITVISSAFHLRRVALVVGRALRGSGVALAYAALPAERDAYGPGQWWRAPRGVRVIASEAVKLAVYAAFLRR
jgi:hypothetical protein